MSYVRPEEVVSPKSRVGGVIEVIHDPGEGQMSVARVLWDEEEVIATRWNGSDERPLGNPVSRGHATWFVVDEYAADSVEQAARAAAERSPTSLVAKYREMANDREREAEAEEWSEGLIGDASPQG
jgi:hypothetical protein